MDHDTRVASGAFGPGKMEESTPPSPLLLKRIKYEALKSELEAKTKELTLRLYVNPITKDGRDALTEILQDSKTKDEMVKEVQRLEQDVVLAAKEFTKERDGIRAQTSLAEGVEADSPLVSAVA